MLIHSNCLTPVEATSEDGGFHIDFFCPYCQVTIIDLVNELEVVEPYIFPQEIHC